MLDTNGSLISHNRSDAWGKPTAPPTGAAGVIPLAYAGRFYHAPSGLYLVEHRAYDPSAGRSLNPDPIAEAGGVNLYPYAAGNPIYYFDRNGLELGTMADRIAGIPPGRDGGDYSLPALPTGSFSWTGQVAVIDRIPVGSTAQCSIDKSGKFVGYFLGIGMVKGRAISIRPNLNEGHSNSCGDANGIGVKVGITVPIGGEFGSPTSSFTTMIGQSNSVGLTGSTGATGHATVGVDYRRESP